MAWKSKSSRTVPLPKDWWRLRAKRLKMDGHRCVRIREDTGQRCTEKATDVNHIGEPHDHRIEMLESLCSWHHNQETGRQGGSRVRQAKKFVSHPGLIGG